ncbi:MAG: shikimate dehydrogenase [Arenicella sp.]
MGSYALLGETLGHSLSPQLHAAIYRQLGHSDSSYRAIEVVPDKMADFFAGFAAGAFDGINITIPYKATALPFLQQIDAKAKRLNAVNCVYRRHGELIGYNTDVSGFAYLLRRHSIDLKGADCAILGAGGSAQAVASVLADGDVRSVKVANRSIDKANRLAMFIESMNPQVKTELVSFDDLSGATLDLMVNTTSLGMSPHVDASALQQADYSHVSAVVDLIYNPAETLMMKEAAAAGAKTVNGLEMLVAQAVYSVEIWFGGNVIAKVDMDALTQELAELVV